MGYREHYKYKLNGWFKTLSKEELKQYQTMFPNTWFSKKYGMDSSLVFSQVIKNKYKKLKGEALVLKYIELWIEFFEDKNVN